MKRGAERCIICMLTAFAGLFITAVGWLIWARTGDPFTTLLAVALLTVFCFLCPGARISETDHDKAIRREVEHLVRSLESTAAGSRKH